MLDGTALRIPARINPFEPRPSNFRFHLYRSQALGEAWGRFWRGETTKEQREEECAAALALPIPEVHGPAQPRRYPAEPKRDPTIDYSANMTRNGPRRAGFYEQIIARGD